ncbi:type II secretion system F family protein [Tessaracoccus sp. Y1736]
MLTAALVAGLAAGLVVGPPPTASARRLRPPRPAHGNALIAVGGAGAALALGAAWLVLGTRSVLWMVAVAVVVSTIGWLEYGRRARREESRAADECAQAARALSSMMRSGNIPRVALAEGARDFPVLASAAAAARLGSDVGRELERAADGPGRAGLRAVAAAWQLSERTGAPIADVLGRVAETLRRQRQLDAVVATELATARTSGHIMATLPFLALGLGLVSGVNTLEYLLTEPLGQWLVLAGVALTSAGVIWVDRLARTGARQARGRR